MKANIKILVVDDEKIVRTSLNNWLKEEGYQCDSAENGMEAISKSKKTVYDLLIVDYKMPVMDGLELLTKLKKDNKDLQIIIMTAYASINTAVKAMKEGAFDYIVKPFDPESVSQIIKRALRFKVLEKENECLREKLVSRDTIDTIIGKSKKMQEIFELIQTIASSETVVMIRGESGTGKELIARAIHANSKRKYGPLVSISCGALPETLLESELFGHVKGAFTGAEYDRKGRLEMADGGTLFLDEIGEISLKSQVDLLRVLQEKTIYRIGSTEPVKINIRIISATNKNLEKAIEERTFREDLYYRLNVIQMKIPPLRERHGDITLLANFFLKKFAKQNSKQIDTISKECIDLFLKYSWPGNVRELENVIESSVVLCKTSEINRNCIPKGIFKKIEETFKEKDNILLKDLEKCHILKVLNKNNWNISKTARELGIDRVTLYNKIKKYSIKNMNEG